MPGHGNGVIMIKTCKECPNYKEILESRGHIFIKCKVIGLTPIRRMDECDFTDTKICAKCARPAWTPCLWKGKRYCLDCFNRFFL